MRLTNELPEIVGGDFELSGANICRPRLPTDDSELREGAGETERHGAFVANGET